MRGARASPGCAPGFTDTYATATQSMRVTRNDVCRSSPHHRGEGGFPRTSCPSVPALGYDKRTQEAKEGGEMRGRRWRLNHPSGHGETIRETVPCHYDNDTTLP